MLGDIAQGHGHGDIFSQAHRLPARNKTARVR
jgi:hypothetical protein